MKNIVPPILLAVSASVGLHGCGQSPENHQRYVEKQNHSGIVQANSNGFTELIQADTQGAVNLIFCIGKQYSNPQKVYQKNSDGSFTVFNAEQIFTSNDINIIPFHEESAIPHPFWINKGTPKKSDKPKCN